MIIEAQTPRVYLLLYIWNLAMLSRQKSVIASALVKWSTAPSAVISFSLITSSILIHPVTSRFIYPACFDCLVSFILHFFLWNLYNRSSKSYVDTQIAILINLTLKNQFLTLNGKIDLQVSYCIYDTWYRYKFQLDWLNIYLNKRCRTC